MTDTLRFHYPGRQFGKKCEKCGKPMKEHVYIDVDDEGKIVRCSVKDGVKKK